MSERKRRDPAAVRRRCDEARAFAVERLRHERDPHMREGLALLVELADEAEALAGEAAPDAAP